MIFVNLQAVHDDAHHLLLQCLELGQDLVISHALKEAASGLERRDPRLNLLCILHICLKDAEEALAVDAELLLRQVALRHLLKRVECELLGLDVLRLSPIHEQFQELLRLLLELEDLR